MWDAVVMGAAAGAVGGVVAVVVVAVVARPKPCPNCDTPPPLFRLPKSGRQLMLGGWTCRTCGCELDRRGRRRDPDERPARRYEEYDE